MNSVVIAVLSCACTVLTPTWQVKLAENKKRTLWFERRSSRWACFVVFQLWLWSTDSVTSMPTAVRATHPIAH